MSNKANFDDIPRLENQADDVANAIAEWETEAVARICKQIGKIGRMSKKDAEKFDVEKESQKMWLGIAGILAVAVASDIRSLKKSYATEVNAWHNANKYLYDYRRIPFTDVSQNKQMQGIIESYAKQNAKDILNITNTKALRVLDRNGNAIRLKDAIYKAFGDAVKKVTSGDKDFYSAMRDTVQNLGGGGCKVDYGEGITRRLDTVVRQNMLWGIKQAHKEYNEIVGQELGCDGIEIDLHSNSRPSHRYMQGKQYAKGAQGKTVNGVFYPSAEKEGVYDRLYEDYNCRHYETDIILGVSEPRYSAEELKRFEEQDKRLYKIGNLEGDGYYFSQKLRNIEAEVRKMKDEINALKSFGNSANEIKELKSKINTYRKKYNEISEITGISKEPKRLSVPNT